MLMTLLLSLLTRSVYLMVSLLAILPWVVLSFFAINQMASSFSNYYAFPFIVMLSWPILSLLIEKKFSKVYSNNLLLIIGLTTLIPLLSTTIFVNNAKNNTDEKPWERINFNNYNC